MSLDRSLLPLPESYFEERGVSLKGQGLWKTGRCIFHGGSDSMRVNVATGAWVCMNCSTKGGDVLAFEMKSTGSEFVEACKAVGAWVEDGRPYVQQRPSPLTPRQALSVLAFESTLVAVAAGNASKDVVLSAADMARLLTAARRINMIAEAFQ